MKLHFEPDLDYQQAAIAAVTDLFRGQEISRTEFTVTQAADGGAQGLLGLTESELGVGNRLRLLDEELLANLTAVQVRNGLRPSERLASGDFTVEMETGTGKTYVYLRTIFELNARYGFTKFVIVVPSVAVKEGVYKTLQMTEEHFRGLYANRPFEYFLYDSSKLGQVRNFATSATIQIMIVTVGAINKQDVNNLYKDSEKTGGEKPIDLIRATRPVIVVDEPQSVEGGLQGRGREALKAMNPLCMLRYSATPRDAHHMVYKLDAVDAYERKLVKQIEVAALTVEGDHNAPYVRLKSVKSARGRWTAKLELDVQRGTGVERMEKAVSPGDDLAQVTGRALYEGWQVGAMSVRDGVETVEITALAEPLRKGEATGGADEDQLKRVMIRRTIAEHLTKELRLAPQGIKVLSLFFIDAVEHYRRYAADGTPEQGKYAVMFEEEYAKEIRLPKYRSLFQDVDLASEPATVHGGYFSIDRKVVSPFEDHELKRSASKEAVETDTYNLIMKEKERLLSFDTKLKFIFSHSALREGWDNPNVFQICALREIGTEQARRQTIGRGLRLCVDQTGVRRRGFEVNTLTVVANESYERFAEALQQEIETDTGFRFGVVETHAFAAIPVMGADGTEAPLGMERSEMLWTHLRETGYIDGQGRVQDALRTALRTATLELPAGFEAQRQGVAEVLRKLAGSLQIRNADERRAVPTREAVLASEEFRALWERVRQRTTYRVEFDNEQLKRDCIAALRDMPPVARARVQARTAELAIGQGGVAAHEVRAEAPVTVDEAGVQLPDVLTVLQDATQLTRRTIAHVLTESGRLNDLARNPQQFVTLATEAINRTKRRALVDGIRYRRLGDGAYYAQELFAEEELTGYLRNMVPSTKSPYESVVYDSETVERPFAVDLENNAAVRVYAKLPGWFTVPTPLGSYNPDWAVLVEQDGGDRLYFVVETKGSLFADDLRSTEKLKIDCAREHFRTVAVGERPAEYVVERTVDGLLSRIPG